MGDKPKKALTSLGYSVQEEEEPLTCCGFCGIFSFKNPEISSRMWKKKEQNIKKQKADLIATDCPGCLFQLKANLQGKRPARKIVHTAELCAEAIKK